MDKKFTCDNIEQLLDMATYFIQTINLSKEDLDKIKSRTFDVAYAINEKSKKLR